MRPLLSSLPSPPERQLTNDATLASRTSPPSPPIPLAGRVDVADVVSNRQTPPILPTTTFQSPCRAPQFPPARSLPRRPAQRRIGFVLLSPPPPSFLSFFYLLPATVGRHKMGFFFFGGAGRCQCAGRRAVGYIESLGLLRGEVREMRERRAPVHSPAFF